MDQDPQNTVAAPEVLTEPPSPPLYRHTSQRGFIAEWTVTIILLLFGTTTLVQAFVIPTGSMEDTLLIGDHLLVDKLAYSPGGPVSSHILPYREVKRGDIIVFRYPVDIRQTFVKRAIGVPGDHIQLVNKQLVLNGQPVNEPYVYHKTEYIDSYRDNFPSDPNVHVSEGALDMLTNHVKNGEVVVPPGYVFRHGRQSRFLARQPLLGLRAAREHHRQTADHLLVVRRANRAARGPVYIDRTPARPGHAFSDQDALEPHVPPDSRLSAELNERTSLRPDSGRRARHALLAAQPQALRQAGAERGGRTVA